jgi:hypothetical protein
MVSGNISPRLTEQEIADGLMQSGITRTKRKSNYSGSMTILLRKVFANTLSEDESFDAYSDTLSAIKNN